MFDFDAAFEKLKAEKTAANDATRKQRGADHELLHTLYRKLDAFRDKWSIPLDTRLEDGVLHASKNQHDGRQITVSGGQTFDVKRVRAGVVSTGSDLDLVGLDEQAVTDHLVRWAVGD